MPTNFRNIHVHQPVRVRFLFSYVLLLTVIDMPVPPQSRVFPMSSPSSPAMQHLHYLDKSASDFQDKHSNILYGQGHEQCVWGLQGDDLAWLVDYLNEVRRCVPLPHSPLGLA